MKPSIIRNDNHILQKSIILLIWLLIWEICSILVGNHVLLVSPLQVAQSLFQKLGLISFWKIVLFSVLRILKGYGFGIILGSLLGVFSAKFRWLYEFFYPLLSVIKATPVASFIILALIWMQTNTVPSFISFLMVFPIIYTNVVEGMRNVTPGFLDIAKVYHWSLWKQAKLIYIPSCMPYFSAGCTISMGLAWKAGIATEVIASFPFSIGGLLRESKVYLETTELFSWTVVVIILSVSLENTLLYILKKLERKWERQGTK